MVSVGAPPVVQGVLEDGERGSVSVDDGASAQGVGAARGVYKGGQVPHHALAMKALSMIEDSVPAVAKSCRPADTIDQNLLAYIWETQPNITFPAPPHSRLPKDLDILAELQDASGFDVRSWHGTIRRQCLYEELLDLLHYHLVLPMSFPMRLLCITASGDELTVNSDHTLKATILHVLPSQDRSGRARIVIAVRRALTPLFHTSVRHAAALRVQCAMRKVYLSYLCMYRYIYTYIRVHIYIYTSFLGHRAFAPYFAGALAVPRYSCIRVIIEDRLCECRGVARY